MKSSKFFAIPAIASVLLISACGHFSGSKDLSPPSKELSKKSGVPHSTLMDGYGIYMRQCYQCHAQPDPSTLTGDQWNTIVPVMAQHAGISEKDKKAVLAYLLAHKEK